MKRSHKSFTLLFILAGFISCEKDIEFKGDITDPLLVMNGMLTPDSVVSVHLSSSRFVLGEVSLFKDVFDATVSVFVNGDLKEQLVHGENGIYTGNYHPEPGDEIRIEATADGFDKIISQTVIPETPYIEVGDKTVTLQSGTTRNMHVQLKLTDAANEENYYFIKASQYFLDNNGVLVLERTVELNLSDVLKNNVSDNDNFFQDILGDEEEENRIGNLFSDMFVDGKDILFDFSFYDVFESGIYTDGEKMDYEDGYKENMTVECVVEIGEISKDLYQYLISGNQALNAQNYALFNELVMIHTNIENGVGILGAYNTYRFSSGF